MLTLILCSLSIVCIGITISPLKDKPIPYEDRYLGFIIFMLLFGIPVITICHLFAVVAEFFM